MDNVLARTLILVSIPIHRLPLYIITVIRMFDININWFTSADFLIRPFGRQDRAG